ncbi:MAG: hypothetical protein NUV69_03020 [Candidatus Curtissbacteria bacterium]|nr:hypothetical protein [Candidatus Curtissbacteria bacterium]
MEERLSDNSQESESPWSPRMLGFIAVSWFLSEAAVLGAAVVSSDNESTRLVALAGCY